MGALISSADIDAKAIMAFLHLYKKIEEQKREATLIRISRVLKTTHFLSLDNLKSLRNAFAAKNNSTAQVTEMLTCLEVWVDASQRLVTHFPSEYDDATLKALLSLLIGFQKFVDQITELAFD